MGRQTALAKGELLFFCARCGRVAAAIALLPAGTVAGDQLAGEEYLESKDRIRRRGFLGVLDLLREPDDLRALYRTVAAGDFRAAQQIEHDLAAFHCPDCDLVYCDRCWQVESPVFDDGFYDYTEAVCPASHRHIVDD